jgi:predicted esterase
LDRRTVALRAAPARGYDARMDRHSPSHRHQRVFALVLAVLALAGGGTAPGPVGAQGLQLPVDRVVPDLASASDPAQRYALYLPPGYPGDRRWPVLLVLDPRGRAELGARLFEAGARRNGWIVISASGSRSDEAQGATLRAVQALLGDAERRFASDPQRLYLAGMSGTAKLAWVLLDPLGGRVAGIVGCAGARPPDLPPLRAAPPPFAGCTGTRDYNHASMRGLDARLAALGAPRRLDVFAGGHGWAEAETMSAAVDWLEWLVVRPTASAARADAAWQRASAAPLPDAPLPRWRALDQRLRDFPGRRELATLAAERDALAASPALRDALAAEQGWLDGDATYQRAVDAWVQRMQPGFTEGQRRTPPARAESMRMLRVRSLVQLAASTEPGAADAAARRLALARNAAAAFVPALARARGDEAMARAALEVAEALPTP